MKQEQYVLNFAFSQLNVQYPETSYWMRFSKAPNRHHKNQRQLYSTNSM